jgi:hypothetical protein
VRARFPTTTSFEVVSIWIDYLFVYVLDQEHVCYPVTMSEGIDELELAIDSLLAVDPSELTDSELHELVIRLQHQRHRLAAAAGAVISSWDQRMVWADNGAGSAAVRLANDTAASPSSAGVEVKRARRLRTMPLVAAALASGDISPDHADLLARADQPWRHADFADHEATLVEQCKALRFRDARKMVDYWCLRADASAAEDHAERQRNAAHLNVSSTLDGTVVVNGTLDPIGGAIVNDEIDRIERELYLADKRDGVTRTASQRRGAALVEMATRSAIAPADGQRPRPRFTVLVGDETMSHLCELANGTVVTPGSIFEYAGDADLETVLFDGPSTVISVSHRRTFTGQLRRAVQVRDRHCQHESGCDVPADQCDIDHIVPHAADGPTSQFNGKAECHPHNRNPDRHDHGGIPRPARPIDRLDEIRCRLRWQMLREDADTDDDRPDDSSASTGAVSQPRSPGAPRSP